jgi:hypothetical protein
MHSLLRRRKPNASGVSADHRLKTRYAILTALLFIPLLTAFIFVRNLYPFAASTMMMAGGDLQTGSDYYVLRGETLNGEIIDLPAIDLTNALSGRAWGLVSATVDNKSFLIRNPHPENVALIASAAGVKNLPRAARLPELLRAWGSIYNSRFPGSAQRLRAVRLDAYRWDGGSYSNYDRLIQSWRVEL